MGEGRGGEGTIQFMRDVRSRALVRARPARPGLTRSTVLSSTATVKVTRVPMSSRRTDSHLHVQTVEGLLLTTVKALRLPRTID